MQNAKWLVLLPSISSEYEKTACDLFDCPVIISQSLISVRKQIPSVLSKFLLIKTFFALFNPFETTKITSVLFSMFELNRILCKTNLYL